MGSLAERLRTAPRTGCLAISLHKAATGEEVACPDSRVCLECWDRVKDVLADAVEKERTKTEHDGVIPEGIVWPTFEDGELVKFGDKYLDVEKPVGAIELFTHGFCINGIYFRKGEPVKRPEPEVLDADGVPIKVGDTVWYASQIIKDAATVVCIKESAVEDTKVFVSVGGEELWNYPRFLTHRKPDTQEDINAYIIEQWRDGVCPQTPPFMRDKCRDLCTCNSCLAERIMETCDRQRKLMGGE